MALDFIFGTNASRMVKIVRGITALVLVSLLLGGVIAMTYPDNQPGDQGVVPLIRADATPFKVMPKEPGGMAIPHRDSTVFETYRSASVDAKIESLLPAPEKPMDRDELFAGLKTEFDDAATGRPSAVGKIEKTASVPEEAIKPQEIIKQNIDAGDMASAVLSTAEENPQKVTAVTAVTAVVPQPVTKPEISQESADEAASTEPAAGYEPKNVENIENNGAYRVQLGSFRSARDAEKGWQVLRDSFPDELGALDLHVEKADLGSRGIYYRVQAGLVEEKQARAICQTVMQKRPGGCLVVSP